MVGEAGEGDVIGRLDLHCVAVAGGSVFLSVHGEGLRLLAKILVQNGLDGPLPCGAEGLVGVLDGDVHHCVEHCVELSGHGQFGAVVHAGHELVGNDAVVADDIQNVVGFRADGEIELAVEAHVFDRPLEVGIAHHVELGKVGVLEGIRDLAQADCLGLEESDGGIGPAGAAAVLVLDGCNRVCLDRRELIIRELYCRLRLGESSGGDKSKRQDNR